MKTYNFHTDPGHGWLEVPMADLPPRFKPSCYSYRSRDGKTAYLEEDCDAPRFLGITGASYRDGDTDAEWIRNLPRFA